MKVNCRAVKLSIIISIIFLTLSILLKLIDIKYANNFTEFMKDIGLGVFCSSIVTVFFYISAYKVERKKVLEQYWNECRKLLMELMKIDFMNISFKEDVFIGFINEQKNKLWITEYYKEISQKIPKENFKYTNLIKKKIVEDNNELFEKLSEEAREKYLEEKIENLYNKSIDNINKIVDQYLHYLNYSMDNLNFILGDIEFFTGKKNYIKAHELFQNIYDLRIKIQESARHFRYYKDGEGNKTIVLSEILKLQKNIFRVEENEDAKIVYREFDDFMEVRLEEFRAKIIYNIEPDKVEIVPLMETVKIH